MTRRVVIYARISVATKNSVSIPRQVESGVQHAAAQGWTVVGTFVDEGVSASSNKPEDRPGWKALLASREPFDAVLVWKVDRLARRITDFWDTYKSLQQSGRSLASVADHLDMSTGMGRIVAGVLAGFAEMEAEAISARVTAARAKLLRSGRYVGGTPLYGYRAVPNPDGAGLVLAHDEDQIGYVREMVRRTLAGLSLYSTTAWLDEVGAPTKTGAEKWSYTTVDRIVRHPNLAGMVPHNPGHTDGRNRRGEGVVRDDSGMPVVDETLAIMSLGQWRAMQARLAEPTPQRAPRAMRRKHSGLLSGLLWCGHPAHDEPVKMQRGTAGTTAKGPRPAYLCPSHHNTLSNAQDVIVRYFLEVQGPEYRLTAFEEVVEGGSAQFQEASIHLEELSREFLGETTTERNAEILEEMSRLKVVQEQARNQPSTTRLVEVDKPQTFAQDWAEATTDEERRTVLDSALDHIVVRPGKQGQWTDPAKLARCEFVWKPGYGPYEPPTDAELAAWAAAYYKP